MFTFSTTFRVLYADTDNMQYVYYGNYARYYEMARTEALRSIGLPYKELEKQGVAMPVIHLSTDFLKPAFYDQLLRIIVIIDKLPQTRIHFRYEIYNENETLINKGETTLIFWDLSRGKPVRSPGRLIEKLEVFFEN
jgi:acyl-CoA thioester hydrolase